MTSTDDFQLSASVRSGSQGHAIASVLRKPMTIYEVEPDSWMRMPEQNNRPLTLAEIAPKLAHYALRMNFTHVELLFQPGKLLQGERKELTQLIDCLHQHGLGVLLDGISAGTPGRQESPERPSPGHSIMELHADGWRVNDGLSLFEGEAVLEMKWDLNWTRDILNYFGNDPLYRKFHHQQLIDRVNPAVREDFVLPLSHREVQGGRPSLLARMPGDEWQKFANLRLLLAFMVAQPGKKLLFMGGEFGQWDGWRPDSSLDWHEVQEGNFHRKLQRWVSELNHFYSQEPSFHGMDSMPGGFEWVDHSDAECSTMSWLRKGTEDLILAVFNFTPVPRHNYRVGVPGSGFWREMLNSDAREYGGSGQGNLGGVEAAPLGWHFKSHSLTITLPPLGAVFFKRGN